MVKYVDTKEVLERLQAYRRPGNMVDVNQLCQDIVILTKWSGNEWHHLMSELKYQWDTVHLPGDKSVIKKTPGFPS
jgi:hypothetical protein